MVDDRFGLSDRNSELVLSISRDESLLKVREHALRSAGYEVFSVTTEVKARFEIEMGQCGVLLLCHTLNQAVQRDLATLFAKNCHTGVIAFVMRSSDARPSPFADISLSDSDFARQIPFARTWRDKSA